MLVLSGWVTKENFSDVFEGDSRAPPSHAKGFATIWAVTKLDVPIRWSSVDQASSGSRVHTARVSTVRPRKCPNRAKLS